MTHDHRRRRLLARPCPTRPRAPSSRRACHCALLAVEIALAVAAGRRRVPDLPSPRSSSSTPTPEPASRRPRSTRPTRARTPVGSAVRRGICARPQPRAAGRGLRFLAFEHRGNPGAFFKGASRSCARPPISVSSRLDRLTYPFRITWQTADPWCGARREPVASQQFCQPLSSRENLPSQSHFPGGTVSFPVIEARFPDCSLNFPCYAHQGKAPQTIESSERKPRKIRPSSQNSGIFPVFSRKTGKNTDETGSIVTAFATTHSAPTGDFLALRK